jgi:hypothetical protein
MNDEMLGTAITRAERASSSVADSALRVKAFEVILSRLLVPELSFENRPVTSHATGRPDERPIGHSLTKEPRTLSQRIVALQSEGFFKEPRAIGNVREGLRNRGWHYPVTTLSGALHGLIQKRRLRRERVREGHKTAWKYSNP